MREFTLRVHTDNGAFEENPEGELARLLAETAVRVDGGVRRGVLLDVNGNTVGRFEWRR